MGANESKELSDNTTTNNNQTNTNSSDEKNINNNSLPVNPLSKESIHQQEENNNNNNQQPEEEEGEGNEEVENSNKNRKTSSLSSKTLKEGNHTLNVTLAAATFKQNTKPLAPNSAEQADLVTNTSAIMNNNNNNNNSPSSTANDEVNLTSEYETLDQRNNNQHDGEDNDNNNNNNNNNDTLQQQQQQGRRESMSNNNNDNTSVSDVSRTSSLATSASNNNTNTTNTTREQSISDSTNNNTANNSAQPSQHASPQPPHPPSSMSAAALQNKNSNTTATANAGPNSATLSSTSPPKNTTQASPSPPQKKQRKVLHGDNLEYKYPSGSVYKGAFREGKLHGYGRYTYHPSGDIYEGEWENDMKHGRGIYTYEGGDRYTGDWRNGKKYGRGTYCFQSGDEYIGGWKEDKIHGYGTFFVARNGNRYEGEWRESYRHGQGILKSGNGNVYEGSWHKGKEDGHGVLIQPCGKIYAGGWKQGQMDGKGILYDEGEKVLVENIGGFVTSKTVVPEDATVDPAWNVANKLYQNARNGKIGIVNKVSLDNNTNGDGSVSGGGNNNNNNNGTLLETKIQQLQVERDNYRKKYEDLLALKGKTIPTPDGADDYIKEDLNPDDLTVEKSQQDDNIIEALKQMVDHARSQRNAQRLRAEEIQTKYKSSLDHIKELEFMIQSREKELDLVKSGKLSSSSSSSNNEAENLQRRVAELETELRKYNGGGGASSSTSSGPLNNNNNSSSSTETKDIGSMQAKIALLEADKDKLTKKAEELDKIRSQVIEFSKEITALQKKNNDLEKEIRVKDQRLQFDNQQAQSEQSEVQKQQQHEIRELRSDLEKAKQETEAAKQKSAQHIEKLRAAEGLAAQSGEFQAQLELLKQNRQKESAVADRKSEELEKYKKENAVMARQLEEARAAASRASGLLGNNTNNNASGGLPSLGSTVNNNGGGDANGARGQSVISDLEFKIAQIEKDKADREKKEKKKLKKLLHERDEAVAKLTEIQKAFASAQIQLHTMVESKILSIGRLTSSSSSASASNQKYNPPQLTDASTISINDQNFNIDIGFPLDATPDQIISTSGLKNICQQVALGFNCSVITYGAMSSGKTTSIHSLLPLMLRDVLEPCNAKSSSHEVLVETQCVELSVDGLSDLFAESSSTTTSAQDSADTNKSQHHQIKKDAYNNVIFEGCVTRPCNNILAFRDIASSFISASSSSSQNNNRKRKRSHVLYIVNCKFTHRVTSVATFGKFLVADLAGMGNLGNQDDVDSAAYINSSIMKLQQVVDALTTDGQTAVPYKEDLLTCALSDCLGGNSRTAMMVHVPATPIADEDDGGLESTQQSLACVSKVRNVKNALVRRSETNETIALRRALVQIDPAAIPNLNSEIGTIRE